VPGTENDVSAILARFPSLSPEQALHAAKFRAILEDENSRQNLTRLVGMEGFLEGHLRDVVALAESGFLEGDGPFVDLGSGGGVPGLLFSIIYGGRWILVEAEVQKAAFLQRAVEACGATDTRVVHGRIEAVMKGLGPIRAVVCRAVGKVEKIYPWMRQCSTWNRLILFKGPGWGEEWATFQAGRGGRELEVEGEYSYQTQDPEPRSRVIIRLLRVPRGTRKGRPGR
jgi:16S rRNA (guanine527-N7)-methyltransferase